MKLPKGKINKCWAVLALIFLPLFSQASAYWMEVKGSGKLNERVTIQLIYGNIDDFGIRHRQTGKELVLAGDFSFFLVNPAGDKTSLTFNQKADCWEASFLPGQNGTYRILGLNNIHPVVDRLATGGENVLPIDYLCSQYQVGESKGEEKPAQLLDLLIKRDGKTIRVTAFRNQEPEKAKTQLRVFNPENWEKELVLDEKGEAVFSPTMKGMYIIRLDWVDPKPGSYKGMAYTSIRHRCNYCLFID